MQAKFVIIKIGVPFDGTPSVFKVLIEGRDSAGSVERPPTPEEQKLVAKALAAFLTFVIK